MERFLFFFFSGLFIGAKEKKKLFTDELTESSVVLSQVHQNLIENFSRILS